jgi:hypothetical protein
MGKIIWTDRLGNEGVFIGVKEEELSYEQKRRKRNRIGLILRRNCLLKHVIEGKIEVKIQVTGRRRRQLLGYLT